LVTVGVGLDDVVIYITVMDVRGRRVLALGQQLGDRGRRLLRRRCNDGTGGTSLFVRLDGLGLDALVSPFESGGAVLEEVKQLLASAGEVVLTGGSLLIWIAANESFEGF
jgi:hypothetical protein